VLQLRMCDADRERYGGPEWLDYDAAVLDDTPCDELEDIEAQTGVVLFRAVQEPEAAAALRLWLWLALARAGVDIAWPDFTPRTMKLRVRSGDADPPASAPPSTSASPTP
jgi:hypothetical protein